MNAHQAMASAQCAQRHERAKLKRQHAHELANIEANMRAEIEHLQVIRDCKTRLIHWLIANGFEFSAKGRVNFPWPNGWIGMKYRVAHGMLPPAPIPEHEWFMTVDISEVRRMRQSVDASRLLSDFLSAIASAMKEHLYVSLLEAEGQIELASRVRATLAQRP